MDLGGTRKRLLRVLLCGVVLSSISTESSAAPPRRKKPAPAATATKEPSPASNKVRAAELFKKSSEAYMRGEFETTVKLLDEAYALDPQPVLVYNTARAHEGLGHADEAIRLYERYLSEEPSSPDRGAIEQRV